MLEILFVDIKTGRVNYGITDVSRVRYITPSEIGFDTNDRSGSCAFPHTEKVEVSHKKNPHVREVQRNG